VTGKTLRRNKKLVWKGTRVGEKSPFTEENRNRRGKPGRDEARRSVIARVRKKITSKGGRGGYKKIGVKVAEYTSRWTYACPIEGKVTSIYS